MLDAKTTTAINNETERLKEVKKVHQQSKECTGKDCKICKDLDEQIYLSQPLD